MERARTAEELKIHFNEVGTGDTYPSYEARRWSQNERTRVQRKATEHFITHVVIPYFRQNNPKLFLELGPGPGTWTTLLANHFPGSLFVLTDISNEMLRRTKEALGDRVQATVEGDFLSIDLPTLPYDTFFSSRALEYVGDPTKAIEKISTLLTATGRGCVITKMPKDYLKQMRGKTTSLRHQGQVRPHMLRKALQKAGCKTIRLYPVTCSVPLLKSATLDAWCTALFAQFSLNPLSAFFAESYAVLFSKS